ncbi:unnamed protein product [Nippostrongylus brasiliensis]|uniref:Apple domain-containing protein n=1 Tax=Nippostrongylus brasiliensis TaxID=27835 RepID=A0A0N4YE72_NIPBR|nr:unnamed protein product [Nippostrongylus brasiliensis]
MEAEAFVRVALPVSMNSQGRLFSDVVAYFADFSAKGHGCWADRAIMNRTLCWLIVFGAFSLNRARLPPSHHLEKKREPSAFLLARLQREYDTDYENEELGDVSMRRDEVVSDTQCLQRCNKRLNVGMDMVNAHMAFGSIDVPSVMERRDLELFCYLDSKHSQCVDECGYAVQFNLREFVCKKRFNEIEKEPITFNPHPSLTEILHPYEIMAQHLSCYARAAPVLSRHCRSRCGDYTPLVHTPEGYADSAISVIPSVIACDERTVIAVGAAVAAR